MSDTCQGMIQIRNVSGALHRRLKSRAALEGMSLSDYLLAELRRVAERPTLGELRERLERRPAATPAEPAFRRRGSGNSCRAKQGPQAQPAGAAVRLDNNREGVVRLRCLGRNGLKSRTARSCCRDRVLPLVRRVGSEYPERRPRDEMALKIEGVVDSGMHAQEALGGSS